jgi:hypothetical protein
VAAIDYKGKRKRTAATDPGLTHIHSRAELDSHADTCSFGDECLIVSLTGDVVNVSGFTDAIGEMAKIPIATIALAYDCLSTGHTFILFFHQALHVSGMKIHLLSTFQMRNNQVTVNEVALQHLPPEQRVPEGHSIIVDATPHHPKMIIPLDLNGVSSGALFRVPTWEEVNDTSQLNVYHVDMTSNVPWEPHSQGYNIQEGKLRTQLQLGVDLYQPQTRTLYPLQVRGQDQVDDDCGFSLPYEEDLESVDSAEAVPNDLNVLEGGHKVAAIRETGGSFSGDKDSTMQPRLLSRTIASVYQLQQEQAEHYLDHHGALDVDSYAEALLDELGVTENYIDSLAGPQAGSQCHKAKEKGLCWCWETSPELGHWKGSCQEDFGVQNPRGCEGLQAH